MPPLTPPIALTSLSIRDFRGIEKLDLDFRGPDGQPNSLVVLAGPNGSGKTAVLEAALIAAGGYRLAVGRWDKRAVRRGAANYEIHAEFDDNSNLFGSDSRSVVVTADSDHSKKPQIPHWYFSSWREPTLVAAVNVTTSKRGRRPAKTDANRLLNVKQQLVNAAAIQNFPGARVPSSRNYSSLMKTINTAWSRFYPEREDRFEVGLVESDSDEAGAFDVHYIRRDAPTLSVDDLSAGQLEVFLFLAALALNKGREGIVFIDEPELHLDPQWHAPIVRTLMSLQPRAQFIVATHSPAIFEAAMSYERHFLVPEDDPRARAWDRAEARA
jgi:predicted ATPase